jgi:8-hydroxy-5-deazaflavin:NADPH oxidoreductase
MKIAVIGSGIVGQTLGTKLVALGHEVILGTRDASQLDEKKGWAGSLSDWLSAVGPGATVNTFAEAAARSEIIINASNGMASLEALQMAGMENLAGKILMWPMNWISLRECRQNPLPLTQSRWVKRSKPLSPLRKLSKR